MASFKEIIQYQKSHTQKDYVTLQAERTLLYDDTVEPICEAGGTSVETYFKKDGRYQTDKRSWDSKE